MIVGNAAMYLYILVHPLPPPHWAQVLEPRKIVYAVEVLYAVFEAMHFQVGK